MLVYAYSRGGVTETGHPRCGDAGPGPPRRSARGGGRRAVSAVAGRCSRAYVLQAATCAAVVAAMSDARRSWSTRCSQGRRSAFTLTQADPGSFAPGLARTPKELAATNVASGWVEGLSILVAPVVAGVILAVSSTGDGVRGDGCGLRRRRAARRPARDAVTARPAETDEESAVGRGLSVLRHDPNARLLVVLLGAHGVALGALDVLFVELARGVLHLAARGRGYLAGAAGVGSVIAVVVTRASSAYPHLAGFLVVAIAIWSIAFDRARGLIGVLGAVVLLVVAGGAENVRRDRTHAPATRCAAGPVVARSSGRWKGCRWRRTRSARCSRRRWSAPAELPRRSWASAQSSRRRAAHGRKLSTSTGTRRFRSSRIELLRSMPLFAALVRLRSSSLARSLEPVTAAAGSEVIRQGDAGRPLLRDRRRRGRRLRIGPSRRDDEARRRLRRDRPDVRRSTNGNGDGAAPIRISSRSTARRS